MDQTKCPICGNELKASSIGFHKTEVITDLIVCEKCSRRVPPSLLKACCNKFNYALGIRGSKDNPIRFRYAVITGEWVHLELQRAFANLPMNRGIDVRLSEITWCADAPEES